MLVLVLAGVLFSFNANAPALELLFQLPPRLKAFLRHIPSALYTIKRRRQAGKFRLASLSPTLRLGLYPTAQHPAHFVAELRRKLVLPYADKP